MIQNNSGPILTTDGIPLKVSLQKSERKNKIRAFLLVAPLLFFILFTFLIPIGDMLVRSVDDSYINTVFPKTFEKYKKWDRQGLPSEELYKTMFFEVKEGSGFSIGKATTRMNYAKSGWKSLLKKSKRKFKKIEEGPYKEQMIAIDKRWADLEYWKAIGVMVDPTTAGYFLNAVDLKYDVNKEVIQQPENRRIYNHTWFKTFKVSILVMFFCLILGYPISYLLATLPLKYSNLLMICVLLPFWTSLLVRTVAWMVMLQQKGVFNNLLVMAHIIADENRFKLMYNETATIIVMTQILLPFMVLPLYSVMKTISPNYMRAALNLGASPLHAFYKIYMPNSVPGISAGCMLVFILAIGYYITPELVGGKDGQMIGNWIAYHLKTTLNWGLCAALGAILLALMTILYWVYNKIVGIENIKLG
ncbi:MAG: polyamine ABC transporter substrate-binding protein [Candidatus Pelagibacter sp. TMED64]|nr:polyamine ABC transporter substrate-binding protein [Candidatus Pelagibacter sp.]OUU67608.1 MAG: polyamine ABC transporter substrate-binding protein [Candidatus Pelagibacter sp. TMED64]|tara:strand:- start:4326 stop:5579 length:1254 start_codon:yes stop_codon:yes gene_type:complete